MRLFQIRCTVAFDNVKVGDIGGWIEKADNLSGTAWVFGTADYCCLQGFGHTFRTTTVFLTKDKEVRIQCGCFFGTLDEFAAKVEETHGDNKYGKVYKAIIEVIKLIFRE